MGDRQSFDQAAPCSTIFPASNVGYLNKGKIQLAVKGDKRQDSDLSMMLWNVQEVINHLPQQVGLAAGDLIYTGTPDGVGPVVRGDKMVGHKRLSKMELFRSECGRPRTQVS